ncbi:hypothetical protein FEF09_16940 [Chitinophaga pinensis]|uniref:Uncharacterized protein n=1 Tax=Chitinophaga pinensis TaxID=79329 RepID=A0A5C6LPS7_9BACT|nr:hypothetical protein FEF09_16940 [Chitinophaga pinensis]
MVAIQHIESVGKDISVKRNGEKTKEGEIKMKNGDMILLSERNKKDVFACFIEL